MGQAPETGEPGAEMTPARERAAPEDPCLFCPCCSSRLAEIKCKLLCEQCGYYMSCADYY